MISQCLNPACKVPFLYFSDGHVFVVQKKTQSGIVEHFWICGDCVEKFGLRIDDTGLPILVPQEMPGRQLRRLL